jgi:hypothetical protein
MELTQEAMNLIVKNLFEKVGKTFSIEEEYQKIKNKKSTFSRSQRELVVAVYEIANELKLELKNEDIGNI